MPKRYEYSNILQTVANITVDKKVHVGTFNRG